MMTMKLVVIAFVCCCLMASCLAARCSDDFCCAHEMLDKKSTVLSRFLLVQTPSVTICEHWFKYAHHHLDLTDSIWSRTTYLCIWECRVQKEWPEYQKKSCSDQCFENVVLNANHAVQSGSTDAKDEKEIQLYILENMCNRAIQKLIDDSEQHFFKSDCADYNFKALCFPSCHDVRHVDSITKHFVQTPLHEICTRLAEENNTIRFCRSENMHTPNLKSWPRFVYDIFVNSLQVGTVMKFCICSLEFYVFAFICKKREDLKTQIQDTLFYLALPACINAFVSVCFAESNVHELLFTTVLQSFIFFCVMTCLTVLYEQTKKSTPNASSNARLLSPRNSTEEFAHLLSGTLLKRPDKSKRSALTLRQRMSRMFFNENITATEKAKQMIGETFTCSCFDTPMAVKVKSEFKAFFSNLWVNSKFRLRSLIAINYVFGNFVEDNRLWLSDQLDQQKMFPIIMLNDGIVASYLQTGNLPLITNHTKNWAFQNHLNDKMVLNCIELFCMSFAATSMDDVHYKKMEKELQKVQQWRESWNK